MTAAEDFGRVTAWLARRQRPLLVSHERPDGDALGSLAALALILQRRGTRPTVALFAPLPERYEILRSAAAWHVWPPADGGLPPDCDALIILDTCAVAQLTPLETLLADAPPTLVIDHHATRDAVGTRRGDMRLIDETASATALLLAEWAESAGVVFDAALASALFVGIATDCGWFRFTNTDARTLHMAARLVAAGASSSDLYDALHQQEPLARLRLIARMLDSLELRADGKLALLYLRQADFDAAGADPSLTEELVNEATRLRGTEATVLFVEQNDHSVRVNFRSKRWLDVAQLAEQFGGGGHARAAGARLDGSWDQVVPPVVAALTAALQRPPPAQDPADRR